MNGEFIELLQQIATERDIPLDTLIETVETALATAYKRNYNSTAEIQVRIDSGRSATVPFKVFCEKTVVEEVEDPSAEISLVDAQALNADLMIGETVEIDVGMGNFGRIAAQTARQVVVQRIREAERHRIFEEYVARVGEVVTGTVQRREGRNLLISLGNVDAILLPQEQVPSEPYRFNDRLKVYILEVKETNRGPQVLVSRTHPSLIRRLFELEVPEISDGVVTIKSVAREPGARSKIAVTSHDDKVDPVGACVGHRGSRVQAVVNELYDEKIDIVRWNADTGLFIGESLSPAKAVSVKLNEEAKSALVVVPDNQLSLAIGKAGQNVRLAARLTQWRIDIRSEAQLAREQMMKLTMPIEDEEPAEGEEPEIIGSEAIAQTPGIVAGAELSEAVAQEAIGVGEMTDEAIAKMPGIVAGADVSEEVAHEAIGVGIVSDKLSTDVIGEQENAELSEVAAHEAIGVGEMTDEAIAETPKVVADAEPSEAVSHEAIGVGIVSDKLSTDVIGEQENAESNETPAASSNAEIKK